MAKRKMPDSVSFVHVEGRPVPVHELTEAQRRELATRNMLAFLNEFYAGRALFSRAAEGGEGGIRPE